MPFGRDVHLHVMNARPSTLRGGVTVSLPAPNGANGKSFPLHSHSPSTALPLHFHCISTAVLYPSTALHRLSPPFSDPLLQRGSHLRRAVWHEDTVADDGAGTSAVDEHGENVRGHSGDALHLAASRHSEQRRTCSSSRPSADRWAERQQEFLARIEAEIRGGGDFE